MQSTVNQAEIKAVKLDVETGSIQYSEKINQVDKTIRTIAGDEEIVRAALINRLINELDYDPGLIDLEEEYTYKTMGRTKAKSNNGLIDVKVKDDENNPFFFIEVKAPDKYDHDQIYIEGQLFNLAEEEERKNNTKVKYLVYYTIDIYDNAIKDKAIIIDYEKFTNYSDWEQEGKPVIGDELTPGYNQPKKVPLKKGDSKYDLKTQINRNEIIALSGKLHKYLWGGGGTTDTEIFYSLVNIILAKIQDESEKEDGEEYDFQIYKYGNNIENSEKVFNRINQLYRRALKEKLNITDKRKIEKAYVINEEKFPANKLIYAVQELEKFSFLEGRNSLDGKDILGEFFESITRDGFKQTKGQFFTPTPIVQFMYYALEIDKLAIDRLNKDRELPYIIDPSCGSGTFLIEAMKVITKELKYKQADSIKSSRQVQEKYEDLFLPDYKENKWAAEYLYGSEINFDLGIASKVNMILHGDGSTNIFVQDGLLPFRFYDKEVAPNHLKISEPDSYYGNKEVNRKFDVIVSNPPFSVSLDDETKKYLTKSFMFGGKRNSENLFIERWYQLLKENGRFAVVLPENVFDTLENKYIRLFLYKYFKVKAVVSLPQVTFEPYTSTKTSLLFAQKKTKSELKKWNDEWENQGNEWSKLKTRVENYIKVYINGKDKNKYPSIKDDDDKTAKENIIKLIHQYIIEEDTELSVSELLIKYEEQIKELCSYDRDLKDIFGYYNPWWVFSKVSEKMDYPIFMSNIESVGYKRTKRNDYVTENELFDLEIAPNYLEIDEIINKYKKQIKNVEDEIAEFEAERDELQKKAETKSNKTLEKKISSVIDLIEQKEQKLESIDNEFIEVQNVLADYYDDKGYLLEEYADRTDEQLNFHFSKGPLQMYKSTDILLRKNTSQKILDYFREQVKWD
ncbi:restriction endonuclease subunit M [Oceanobacillus halophilus]|uniref:Restriction endonuclease subunit M n=1 Tax=Oceanobacillus halophilus TaxID=930130 RepID=A0A495A0V5_9BACI|nr:restriction endonuclease subunit M [Oceanobacillus halophilus]